MQTVTCAWWRSSGIVAPERGHAPCKCPAVDRPRPTLKSFSFARAPITPNGQTSLESHHRIDADSKLTVIPCPLHFSRFAIGSAHFDLIEVKNGIFRAFEFDFPLLLLPLAAPPTVPLQGPS